MLPTCSRGCFFLRCGGLWDRSLFVVWLVSFLTGDLVSQSGVMGMTDFEIDRQDILPLMTLFQRGLAQECYALAYILIVRRQRELRVGIGTHGSGSNAAQFWRKPTPLSEGEMCWPYMFMLHWELFYFSRFLVWCSLMVVCLWVWKKP